MNVKMKTPLLNSLHRECFVISLTLCVCARERERESRHLQAHNK